MSRLRGVRALAARVAVLLVATAVSLIVAEILCRTVVPQAVLLGAPRTLAEADVRESWISEQWAQKCMQPSIQLGYEPIPERCGRNSLGLLGDEITRIKPPGVRRVLVVGDSVTAQDLYVRELRRLLGENNPAIEILNAGVTGYNTRQEVGWVLDRGLDLAPDLVILAFNLNDYHFTPIVFRDRGKLCFYGQTEIEVYDRVNPVLFSSSALYRLFCCRFGSLRAGAELPKDVAQAQVEEPLRRLAAELRDLHIPLFVVLFTFPVDFVELSPAEAWAHSRIVGLARSLDLETLDLEPVFGTGPELAGLREVLNGQSTGHPNQRGHLLAAEEIYLSLLRNEEISTRLELHLAPAP